MSATVQIPTTDIQGTGLGVLWYGGVAGVGTELAGNSTSTKKFLTQTGTGAVSAAPTWGTLVAADIPGTLAITAISNLTSNGFVQTSGGVGTLGVIADPLIATHGGTGFASFTVGDLLYASSTTVLSKLAAVAVGQVIVSAGTGTAPAWSASPTLTPTQAANTAADGLVLLDSTAASAGNQQYSPRLRLTGQGWKTTATAASQTADWAIDCRTVQGTANPTSFLVFQSQINGAGFVTRLTLSDAGFLGLTGTLTVAAGNVTNILCVGTTMALRIQQNVSGSVVEGVDSTGITSYQPLFVGGSALNLTLSGTTKATLTSGGLAVVNGFGCNAAAAQSAFASGGAAPAGGTGTAAGGWDTAAHRDSAITLLNNIRSALVANGIMS